jgi:hypothetical protein
VQRKYIKQTCEKQTRIEIKIFFAIIHTLSQIQHIERRRRVKTLLVVLAKNRETALRLIEHGGPDVVINTDPFMSQWMRLCFKEQEVFEVMNLFLDKKRIFLQQERMESGWRSLTGYKQTINIETLLAHILDYFKEAKYEVLTSENWVSAPKPMKVLTP